MNRARHRSRVAGLVRTVLAALLAASWLVGEAFAARPSPLHPGEKFEQDDQAPYAGPGWRGAAGGAPAVEFVSSGVRLESWVPLDEIAPGLSDANDCWGYTSPSGREYALIGTNQGLGVVEVTDPKDAQVIAHVPGVTSVWRDVKTYSTYAYVVSEGGGGIQVIDLSDVDNGNVVHVRDVLLGGIHATHNIAINEESRRLYRVGGGNGFPQGVRVYKLANPDWPVFIGEWNDRYCHDAQIVWWRDEPFKGHEIVFCYAEDSSTTGNPGIDILDATDPQNITLISRLDLTVPPIFSHPASYSHQGWLSYDRRFLFVNDEVDEETSGVPTTTRVVDVQDLTNPHQVSIFQNTSFARDHNLYTHGALVYQANYRAGLRVLDASDPFSITEMAFFDTYPQNDGTSYNGLWSVYPYFPSQTIIGSDIEKGLFVWTLAPNATPTLGRGGIAALLLGLVLSAAILLRKPRRR